MWIILYFQIVQNPFFISNNYNGWVHYSEKWRDQIRPFRLNELSPFRDDGSWNKIFCSDWSEFYFFQIDCLIIGVDHFYTFILYEIHFFISNSGNWWVHYNEKWRNEMRRLWLKEFGPFRDDGPQKNFPYWMVGNWCGSFLYFQIVRNSFFILNGGNGWVHYSEKWREQMRRFWLNKLGPFREDGPWNHFFCSH